MFQSTRPRGARPVRQKHTHPMRPCFNPRARVGRDVKSGSSDLLHHVFQSTRPRGARPIVIAIYPYSYPFQSTRPRGARPEKSVYTDVHGQRFNPRARVGRDWGLRLVNPASRPFQSTRPRGARRTHPGRGFASSAVSIHAPAWGATGQAVPRDIAELGFNPRARVGRDQPHARQPAARGRVSIHAPAWGATTLDSGALRVARMFQSTRPRGARPRCRPRNDGPGAVSIHAPAWGATQDHQQVPGLRGRFNPRARVGRDAKQASKALAHKLFQSTRPRGARRSGMSSPSTVSPKFQSTRPRGARRRGRRYRAAQPRFQSTRPRGARPAGFSPGFCPGFGFNPRARVGRDHRRTGSHAQRVTVSIHAPAWGATTTPARPLTHDQVSIHAPAWGATLKHGLTPGFTHSFNPRARVGRDAAGCC